jgi:hypothetical protein
MMSYYCSTVSEMKLGGENGLTCSSSGDERNENSD